MTDQAVVPTEARPSTLLKTAVYQNPAASKQGLMERLFALFFDNLVYPQIWEDPVVDMRALAIQPDDHLVTIASGGCNVLSYLTADPARVTAVDLNPAHLALTRLKLAGVRHLPDYETFRRFFAEADSATNIADYKTHIAPALDDETRKFWSGRDIFLSPRISLFKRNIYRHGLLGYSIFIGHVVARLLGTNPVDIMASRTLEDQRNFFERRLAPLFDNRIVRWLYASPITLYGLGIPPAQYTELAGGRHMADVVRDRVKRLACDYALSDNYFARQAFARSYDTANPDNVLPPYLEAAHWHHIRDRADRVETHNRSVTDVLAQAQAGRVDKVVLLDAQDWMTNDQLNALWSALSRAAAPKARVIFRTAGTQSRLAERVDPQIMAGWRYLDESSKKFAAEDRSAIYGGFHLYMRAS